MLSQRALGDTIRRLRTEHEISQETLTFASGVAISGLSRIKRGLTDPKLTTVGRVARALGLSSTELVAMIEVEGAC